MSTSLRTHTSQGRVMALAHALRSRQWVKNLLVLAAPVLSGELFDSDVLRGTAVAFVVFCLASSGIYLVNDVLDLEADRSHPKKRNRPIAAGLVPPPLAIGTAVVLLTCALAGSFLATPELALVVGCYVVLQLLYCFFLKDQRVAATGIVLSQWFLMAAGFGALFMASGKRYAEAKMEGDLVAMRASLAGYTQTYLRFVWTMSATMLMVTYGLWAFEMRASTDSVMPVLSMAPFVLAVLRYALHVDAGEADAPEVIAWHDRVLQVLALIWFLTLAWSLWL
jgi:decaprenyl-phosphate phosphoribosyltransferase